AAGEPVAAATAYRVAQAGSARCSRSTRPCASANTHARSTPATTGSGVRSTTPGATGTRKVKLLTRSDEILIADLTTTSIGDVVVVAATMRLGNTRQGVTRLHSVRARSGAGVCTSSVANTGRRSAPVEARRSR